MNKLLYVAIDIDVVMTHPGWVRTVLDRFIYMTWWYIVYVVYVAR